MNRYSSLGWLILILASGNPPANAAEFTLVDALGVAAGQVVTAPGRLWVSLGNGEDWVYVRDFRFDTPDGRYVGYYNATLARVLRYPRDGWGTIYRADFDDPLFVYTPADFRSVPAGISPPVTRYPGVPSGYPSFYPPGGLPGGLPGPVLAQPLPTPPIVPPYVAPPRSSVEVIDEAITPGATLPPVTLTLVNPSDQTLSVQVADALGEVGLTDITVPPGGTHALQLPRRGDDVQTRTIRVTSPQTGRSETRTTTTTIDPLPRYNVSVARQVLRSIAIDRTGKDPEPISDARFEQTLIGEFLLPPDPRLTDQSIDLPASAAAFRVIQP